MAVNPHVRDIVVLRNVILEFWTLLVTGGEEGGQSEKKGWMEIREIVLDSGIKVGKFVDKQVLYLLLMSMLWKRKPHIIGEQERANLVV